MTEYEKMRSGEIYLYPQNPEFIEARDSRLEMLYDFNHARPSEEKREMNC